MEKLQSGKFHNDPFFGALCTPGGGSGVVELAAFFHAFDDDFDG